MKKIFLAFILVWIAFGIGIIATFTTAQGLMGTPSSVEKNKKLFGVEDFIDQESKIMNRASSAQLHGNMTAYNLLLNQYNVLVCIDNTLLSHSVNDTTSQELDSQAADSCDTTITGLLTHQDNNPLSKLMAPKWYKPDLGNNQTILNWAHLYLKVRGIQ